MTAAQRQANYLTCVHKQILSAVCATWLLHRFGAPQLLLTFWHLIHSLV